MNNKLQQAIQLHRKGALEEAHQLYTELLEEEPSAEVIYLITLVLVGANRYPDAVNFISHAVKLSPQEPLYLFAMGFLSQELHWKDQCIQAYQKAIINRPGYAEAMTNLGFAYTEYNDYDQAMRCYRAAVTTNPTAYPAYVGFAITLHRMGLEKDALETLEIALQIQPQLSQEGETPTQTIQRLNEGKPLIYHPPITLPEPSFPQAPNIGKSKPKLRILHQMPMSGGSIVSKCIAVLPEVILFNNIHPRNQEVKDFGQNIFTQSDKWYHLFSDEDKASLSGQSIDYAKGIRMIYDKVAEKGKHMVLRSWSQLDFLGRPFVSNPSGRLELKEALQDSFEVLEIATTRHPIENWLSLSRLTIMSDVSLSDFLKAYKQFAEYAQEMGFIRREDFNEQTDATMRHICKQLELTFDPVYAERWKFEPRIITEPGESMEFISEAPFGGYAENLLEEFEADRQYWSVLKTLGYEHPESTPATT